MSRSLAAAAGVLALAFAGGSSPPPPPPPPPPDAPEVAALVERLAAVDLAARESAAAALGRLGPAAAPAIPALVEAFATDDPYLAGAAAVALARIGPPSVPALAAALADPRRDVRWSATIALGRLGAAAAPAVEALSRALADPHSLTRVGAATALGEIGPPARSVTAALEAALSDVDPDVRFAARAALPRIDPAWRAAPPLEDVAATIERLVPRLMAEHHVPGVAIALVADCRAAWTKAWGTSDVRTQAPVTGETLFEAASMSKPVLALLALQLVDAGRLDLDRPLVAYAEGPFVPDPEWRGRVTARMALSHTTGYPNWRPGEEEREGPVPLLFEPGTRFGYSGEGIFHLQRTVEEITGEPLDRLARRALFEPLGLSRSTFVWTPEAEVRLASGHDADGGFLARSRYTHPNAAYTLYTTAEEYARLLGVVMIAAREGSPVLSRAAAREMLRRQVDVGTREPIERPGPARGLAAGWALGWAGNETAAGDRFHHSGANRTGFRCFSQFAPDRRTGLVVLTNGVGGGELWTRLVAVVGDW